MENKHRKFRIFRKLVLYFKAHEIVPPAEEIDKMWNSVSRIIVESDKVVRYRRSLMKMASVSAAAILLVVFGLSIADKLKKEQNISDIAFELAVVDDTGDEIQLIMSPHKVISIKKTATVTYSPDGTVLVDKEKVSDQTEERSKEEEQYNQLIVPKGKHTMLQLADGSVLHINSGSRVVYPRSFSGKRREIFVNGEIYIDVRRNQSVPFIVKTSRFEVEVLGTAFNVNAYVEDSVSQVVLLRGSVKIKDSFQKTMTLSPNELASIHKGTIGNKRSVVASDYIAWTRGLLILNAEPLGNVLQKLERYFDIGISFDPAVKKMPMHGNLDLNCPLTEILRRIAVTAPVNYKKIETGFYIEKRE